MILGQAIVRTWCYHGHHAFLPLFLDDSYDRNPPAFVGTCRRTESEIRLSIIKASRSRKLTLGIFCGLQFHCLSPG